jgi:hypothetical protein
MSILLKQHLNTHKQQLRTLGLQIIMHAFAYLVVQGLPQHYAALTALYPTAPQLTSCPHSLTVACDGLHVSKHQRPPQRCVLQPERVVHLTVQAVIQQHQLWLTTRLQISNKLIPSITHASIHPSMKENPRMQLWLLQSASGWRHLVSC